MRKMARLPPDAWPPGSWGNPERGAALPTVLSLLTLACFAYVAVSILLAVLRV
jgi:hypothetical protein